jgi:hypothetical protein
MKTGPDALGIAKNENRDEKQKKRDPTPSEPPKTRAGAQNMKTGPDALRTTENVSGGAKHENGTAENEFRHFRERKT